MRAVSVRGPTPTANAGPTGWRSVRSRITPYSGMNTVTGMPDAAWYLARLDTASPSPPVRAYGESSGARWTTGAGVPSGRTSGAMGAPGIGVACTSVLRVRLLRRLGVGLSTSASVSLREELGTTVAPAEAICSVGTDALGPEDVGTMSI